VAAGSDATWPPAVPALAPVEALDRHPLRDHHRLRQTCAARKESGKIFGRPDVLLHRQHGRASWAVGGYRWNRHRLCPRAAPTCRAMEQMGHQVGHRAADGRPPCSSCSKGRFGSGGAAVTGRRGDLQRRAGVPPAGMERNARSTLVIMGSLLGVMFLGPVDARRQDARDALRRRHADGDLPGPGQARLRQLDGRPTCSSTSCRVGTMLILVLAANTSFADFPPAWPRSTPATTSCPASSWCAVTGWCSPTGSSSSPAAAIVTLIAHGRRGSAGLIPLYAIGVFHQLHPCRRRGMTKHHLRVKDPGYGARGLLINAIGAMPLVPRAW